MATSTFEDDFLNDFEDAKDEEEDEDEESSLEGDDGVRMDGEEEEEGAQQEEETTNLDVPKVQLRRDDQEYLQLISAVEGEGRDALVASHRMEDLLHKCNTMLNRIGNEINIWHRGQCRLYRPVFPELEKLVPDPMDFARVILAYGESDEADLTGLLPSATVMVVKVSKSAHVASIRSMQDKAELHDALQAAREILLLDADRSKLLQFVEAQMKAFAPNLYDLVGSRAAALLIGIAGGLDKLARIPSNDIQVLGRRKSVRADTGVVHGANAALERHAGVLAQCPLVLSAPSHLRRKTLRVVAGRVALAARLDETKRDVQSGRMWREEIEKKIEQWLDPGPGKTKKALPVPDAVRPKRRGGRRARKQKEKLGLTTMRTLANREKFGEGSDDVEYSVSAMGLGLGMLTKGTNGRVRVAQAKDTQKLAQHAAKKLRPINAGGSGSSISGFSSLAFTPVQGMELAPSLSSSFVPASSAAAFVSKKRPEVPLFHDAGKKA